MKILRCITVFVLILTLLFLPSCGTGREPVSEKHVMKAWTGEFSEDKLTETITAYKAEYTPIKLDDTWKIIIPVDEAASNHLLPRIAYCGESFEELGSYIDLAGISELNKDSHEITIDCSWLNDPDSWVHKHPMWSFLIMVTTQSDENVFYYVRVTFDNSL